MWSWAERTMTVRRHETTLSIRIEDCLDRWKTIEYSENVTDVWLDERKELDLRLIDERLAHEKSRAGSGARRMGTEVDYGGQVMVDLISSVAGSGQVLINAHLANQAVINHARGNVNDRSSIGVRCGAVRQWSTVSRTPCALCAEKEAPSRGSATRLG